VPEVRVAAKIATYFVFDAAIDRDSVEVEGRATRFRLVDPGERTLYIEPLEALGEGERLSVRVRYKDGDSPASASFALVSHPTVVDTRVEVVRRPSTPEVQVLEEALARCEAEGPSNLVMSGRLGVEGVRARSAELGARAQAGMEVLEGAGYRAGTWALVAVRVHNLPGQQPWTPGEVRLTRADGTEVKVLSLRMDRSRLSPDDTGLVVAETEKPSWPADEVFRVELREKGGGRHLVVGTVKL
jgi:uncharacterized protein (TIGR02268 family)